MMNHVSSIDEARSLGMSTVTKALACACGVDDVSRIDGNVLALAVGEYAGQEVSVKITVSCGKLDFDRKQAAEQYARRKLAQAQYRAERAEKKLEKVKKQLTALVAAMSEKDAPITVETLLQELLD